MEMTTIAGCVFCSFVRMKESKTGYLEGRRKILHEDVSERGPGALHSLPKCIGLALDKVPRL